jgi:RNA polymerase sigma-70 factor, ECF subfamily
MRDWDSNLDGKLLSQALRGSEAAFAELYELRQGSIYRFALHMTGAPSIAEDVTQEAFLTLLESGRRFDTSRGTLQSFLFGIARNHVLKRLNKDRAASHEEISDEFGCEEEILDDLTRRETIECVRRAVLSLPETYREAVVLCDLEDASYEEAAAALECPVGTVRSRLSRGRAMLAQKLADYAAVYSTAPRSSR